MGILSTLPTEEKHENLRVLIEDHGMGNNEGYEETLKGIFANKDSEDNTLKSNWLKQCHQTLMRHVVMKKA